MVIRTSNLQDQRTCFAYMALNLEEDHTYWVNQGCIIVQQPGIPKKEFDLLIIGMQKSDGIKATGKQNLFLFCY
jgi:hypothetical protein